MKKYYAIFLVLTLLFILLLTSCHNPVDPPNDSESDSNSDKPEERITIISNGSTDVSLVCDVSDGFNASYLLSDAISDELNVKLEPSRDTFSDPSQNFEILFGFTNRAQSEKYADKIIAKGDWFIKLDENALVVLAGSMQSYVSAVEYIKDNYIDEQTGVMSVPLSAEVDRTLKSTDFYKQFVSGNIVYAKGNTGSKTSAMALCDAIEEYCGVKMNVTDDSAEREENEIVIGKTNRSTKAPVLSFYDYTIKSDNSTVYINAGGKLAYTNAITALLEKMDFANSIKELETEDFVSELFNPLIHDQSSFVPVWSKELTVPEWMHDFNEKLYAITNPSGRPMSMAHRGDMVNYPENSIEGYLSAALLGADVIEMDLQYTKDGILVVMHDPTLNRTTDVADKKGKNGLPNSVQVADWTYEQLKQLNLLDREKNVTEYKIPSYYEMLLVMRNRCFLSIDAKVDISFQSVQEIMIAADALQTGFYSVYLSSGHGPARSNSYTTIITISKAHPELKELRGYCDKIASYMKMPGHAIRERGWLRDTPSADPSIETHEIYKSDYEAGLRLIYTNNIHLMSSFIAKYEPDLK
ncbi:MAG: glycerophosphodiester phosphodiesterase family protein [Clostridia bacterium]|nr:glycerophosphodiester phosphodiesterase family protein [Clostridia bacterium]